MKIPIWNGIKKTIDANKRVRTAQADYQQKHAQYVAFAEQVQQEVYELGQARIAAIKALEKAVEVIGKARMGIHADNSHQISSIELAKIEQQTAKLTTLAGGSLATGLTVGAVSAIGAYGVVGAIGTASTGTAIASLGGAAATNATLAALGGGSLAAGGLGMAGGAAVLSGIFALPALAGLVIGAEVIGSKAEKKANENIEQIRVEAAKIDREMAQLTAIRLRCREIKATTTKLTDSLCHEMERFEAIQLRVQEIDASVNNLKELLDRETVQLQAIQSRIREHNTVILNLSESLLRTICDFNKKRNWFKRILVMVQRLFARKDHRMHQAALIAEVQNMIMDERAVCKEKYEKQCCAIACTTETLTAAVNERTQCEQKREELIYQVALIAKTLSAMVDEPVGT